MTIQLQTLRDDLRDHLGIDSGDMDDTKIDLLLNRSYWQLLDTFPFREKEVTASFSTVAGTNKYEVPVPFEALRQLSIEDLNDFSHKSLIKMTEYEYENVFINTTDEQDKPQKYYREKNCIKLWPTPDNIYTIVFKYWTVLADLADTNNTPGLPQNWHEIILFGAIWRGYYKLGDVVRAERLKSMHSTMINEAVPTESKEEIDYHEANLEVRLNEYDAR